MTKRRMALPGIMMGAVAAFELLGGPILGQDSDGLVAEGKRVYLANCAVCHGENGSGEGPGAARLRVKPRDLRTGSFKFRSTPSGALPRDEDLDVTLIQGIRGTGMVPQRHLGNAERRAVIAYLKTFSERFMNEQPQAPVEVSPPLPATSEVIGKGRRIYQKAQCAECHGESGRGDGPSAPTMKDDRGLPIAVPDLTRWPLKRGYEPEALFRTIATGLSGTPMPSYSDALEPEEMWVLVRYLESLAPKETRPSLDQLLPGEETVGNTIEEDARRALAR
ncbi:MAG: c-type cytochrome [Acidobacteria bacterium]|nr:c-type cytochrome [Acidobacteriota bacterium]